MDSRLRQMLRDPRTTPLECYWALRKAGAPNNAIEITLMEAGKLSEGIGQFEALQMEAGDITLETARLRVANNLYFEYDFEDEVETVNGWDISGPDFHRTVFIRPLYDEAGNELVETDTVSVDFWIHFEVNRCDVYTVNHH